ncbi:aldose epimerase family protein [Vibrio sp. TH_r3]|uniref:aldose epimerase family protein n=1 Tax=Vibrio sp. TH_r3 TaxID=3082084 RepID=UPI0029556AA4|nr:aldose epimerase family protein [Vibrio sp. TH_r3]MDV7103358.1 aldose epimerase family protein [Vibrio sp. TH_r3]
MQFTETQWGKVPGQDTPVKLFTLSNSNGMKISVTNFGCIVTSIQAPDRNNQIADIVLGYKTLDNYLQGHPFFGAIAGRYANRIRDGRYSLDGKEFQLETNEPSTQQHLHGGTKGFDKYVWDYAIEQNEQQILIHFSRVSPHGESGYGGTLNVVHTIGLDRNNQVHYNFRAVTDQPTVINLVNHSYYNLAGHDSGSVDKHKLKIYADFYTPVDEKSIPTGELLSVQNTGLDFTSMTSIEENMSLMPNGCIDHNYVLHQRNKHNGYSIAADLYEADSGRLMTVLTTQPGVQFYNGCKLSNKPWIARNGYRYQAFSGLCLETQHFPDSPNHAHFPSTRLDPGDVYEQKTIHRFSVK